MTWKPVVFTACIALLATAGCRSAAIDNERNLAASGFQMRMADTPKKLAKLEALPQRKLTRTTFHGGVRFVYADAKYCKCLYAGTEAAYDRYQKLEIHQEIANEELVASQGLDDSWGPWGPWY